MERRQLHAPAVKVTVTAVAAIKDTAIRRHYSFIYWLVVGTDAVITQLQAVLYTKISGKGTEAEGKSEDEWQQMLVKALADKERALVALDDPWTEEQVRYLNPIDGSQTDHRLLVTTRIRDLVRDFQSVHYFQISDFLPTGAEGNTSGATADGGR